MLHQSVACGSLAIHETFDLDQLIRHEFDPEELCIRYFTIEALSSFPNLDSRQMISNIYFLISPQLRSQILERETTNGRFICPKSAC
jgi:hypothetical protein